MTTNQLIAEFILQKIKPNDKVELILQKKDVITGYVLDRDVFVYDQFDDRMQIHAKAFGYKHNHRTYITLAPIENSEQPREIPITGGSDGLSLNIGYLPKPFRRIQVAQICSIRKLD